MAAKFKKGDRVEVIAGKDKGKQGDILTVVSGSRRVVVRLRATLGSTGRKTS